MFAVNTTTSSSANCNYLHHHGNRDIGLVDEFNDPHVSRDQIALLVRLVRERAHKTLMCQFPRAE
jgi:hypothetical protein